MRKRKISQLIVCFIASFFIILICSRSSPLYPFNTWDDSNSYFTVGKSIFKGLVPYRDLFDQKGILHYFLYGIASLISYKTFLGVFIIEWLAAFATCTGMCSIMNLYMRPALSSILTPVLAAVMYSTRSFWWGGSAEEMMIPFLMWGLYLSVRYFKEEYPGQMRWQTLLIGGILAGCILHIKFNSLGFYFAWMIMILVADLIVVQGGIGTRLIVCIRHGLIFIAGMGIATIPWLIYFAINHAVYDWFHVYIYLNVFVYSEKLPMLHRIYNMCRIIYNQLLANPVCGFLAAAGVIGFVVMKGRVIEKINVLFLGAILAMVIFIGGVELPYYALPLWMFVVFAGVLVGRVYEAIIRRKIADIPDVQSEEKSVNGKKDLIISCSYLVSIVAAVAIVLFSSMNPFFIKYRKEDLWQYKYAELIAGSGIENPTLLNVGCFDAGLYTVTGIVPTCRFFQTQTIKLSNVADVQNDYIQNGRTDFVLARGGLPEGIADHYVFVSQEDWEQSGDVFTFYLFQRVN